MKILMLYNEFRSMRGGEDKVVENMMSLFERRHVDVRLITRSSKHLGVARKFKAFFSGIYSLEASRYIRRVIALEDPDVVHVHNLYPFFSPSVLVASRSANTPVVMTVHNFAMTCPHWFHYRDGQVCELCVNGNTMWCVVHNCQKDIFESTGYAIRSAVARGLGLFRKNVSSFIALTEFAKNRLVSAGVDHKKIEVIPNMIDIPEEATHVSDGTYVAFAGRMSPEKGVETLIAAADLLPEVPMRLAGGGPLLESLQSKAPGNVCFTGLLNAQELRDFYRSARFLVVPSLWFEMCPTTILEAMALGLPVVASRIGGLPEFVRDGETGFVFEPGDSKDLAAKVRILWENVDLCAAMGKAGRSWVVRHCSEDVHFAKLMNVYRRVMVQQPRTPVSSVEATRYDTPETGS